MYDYMYTITHRIIIYVCSTPQGHSVPKMDCKAFDVGSHVPPRQVLSIQKMTKLLVTLGPYDTASFTASYPPVSQDLDEVCPNMQNSLKIIKVDHDTQQSYIAHPRCTL